VSVPGLAPVGYDPLEAAVRNAFANAEKGIVLSDFGDFSRLFQDDAGTTPVTAVGQSVKRINAICPAGLYASQSDTAKAPILGREPMGGRRNLLTYTEDFSNAVWDFTHSGDATYSKTPNYGISPDGTQTACRILIDKGTGGSYAGFRQVISGSFNIRTQSLWIKSNTGVNQSFQFNDGYDSIKTITVTSTWARYETTFSLVGSTSWFTLTNYTGADNKILDILIFNPQFDTVPAATAYQKVVSAYDVTEAGKRNLHYLQFDGSNDYQVTPSIDFTGTDKMSVWLGLDIPAAETDAAIIGLGEESTAGSVFLYKGAAYLYVYKKGTGALGYVGITNPSTTKFTVAFEQDFAGATYLTEVPYYGINGVKDTNYGSAGTPDTGDGPFQNAALSIGKLLGAASYPTTGKYYSIIVRGALSTAAQIQAIEQYTNSKTGAY
jgi:hypothetical protein